MIQHVKDLATVDVKDIRLFEGEISFLAIVIVQFLQNIVNGLGDSLGGPRG
jgi:hypothetical protein